MNMSLIAAETGEHADPVDFLWGLIAAPTIDPVTLARGIENATDEGKSSIGGRCN